MRALVQKIGEGKDLGEPEAEADGSYERALRNGSDSRMPGLDASAIITIRALYHRVVRLLDEGEVGAWLACFTRDASMRLPDGRRFQGYAELRRFAAAHRSRQRYQGSKAVHVVLGVRLVLMDAGSAVGTCVSQLRTGNSDGSYTVLAAGRYHDRLVYEGGSWRFTSRVVRSLPGDWI